MDKKPLRGLLGVFGIWIAAATALPLVKLLPFEATQLMIARGVITALIALAIVRRAAFRFDKAALVTGTLFAFACLGLYNGIKAWGVALTITVVTATPVVNFLFTWARGGKVALPAIASLVVLLGGVALALAPWTWTFTAIGAGIFWSVFGTLINGFFYEALARTKTDRFILCFWQGLAVAVLGAFLGTHGDWKLFLELPGKFILLLVVFALVGGFLYFLANIEAFKNLSTPVASVLAQGETPAVILGGTVILGEWLSPLQWAGVLSALGAAWFLSNWTATQAFNEKRNHLRLVETATEGGRR